jgi:hypothetical protein
MKKEEREKRGRGQKKMILHHGEEYKEITVGTCKQIPIWVLPGWGQLGTA